VDGHPPFPIAGHVGREYYWKLPILTVIVLCDDNRHLKLYYVREVLERGGQLDVLEGIRGARGHHVERGSSMKTDPTLRRSQRRHGQ
jgi:hypothetical protein